MVSYQKENKRIAQNTLIIYGRILIRTIVGIFTSRFVLQALGVSDFGLYHVVGGVIGLLNFINGAMSTTTTRFINVEMGKKDGDPNRIFNVCQIIHIGFALSLIILAETIGIWYINNYLNVEPGKEADAMLIFQISLLGTCIGITNIPYSSLFIAYEKFLTTSTISILNTFLNLFWVIFLLHYDGNVLRLYAIGRIGFALWTFSLYHIIAYKWWPKVIKPKIIRDKEAYKGIFVFNGYNILSSLSVICRSQGSNMLINFFFGTLVNGAFSVAYSIQQYILTLTDNVDKAAAPQIVQNYSGENHERSTYLVDKIGKFAVLIMEVVYFPVAMNIEFLLDLWLAKVPDGAVTFCQYTMFIAFIAPTSAGMGQVINASGKIKWFKIEMATLYVLVIPIGFVLFKQGFPPQTILGLFILSDILNRIIQLILMKKILNFDSVRFIKNAYLRPFYIALIMFPITMLYKQINMPNGWVNFAGLCLSVLITMFIVYNIGFTKSEKQRVIGFAKSKIKR